MYFLHIIPPSQRYMSGFMVMMQRYFNNDAEDTHCYLTHSEILAGDRGLLRFENVTHFPDIGRGKIKRFLFIRNLFEKADYIVFHSFIPDNKWLLLCYILKRNLKKAAWVIWGIDLYNYQSDKGFITAKIKNKINKDLRQRMRYPIVISEADIDVYNREIGTQPILCAAYPFLDVRFEQMDGFIKDEQSKRESNDRRTRILVGHNAFPFNNHIQSIDLLKRFFCEKKSENLEISIPVSYGDTGTQYGIRYIEDLKQYVLSAGMSSQVAFLDKLIDADDYTKFLSTIDIGIFNAERQSGLGNILQLLYMGKKIYMTRKNPLFEQLSKNGFSIHDIDELNVISLEEFVKPDKDTNASQIIKACRSIENVSRAWENVFEYIKGNKGAESAMNENLKYLIF